MESELSVFTRPPELYTGLTNFLILLCCVFFIHKIRKTGPVGTRRKVWLTMFILLILASGWGTFNHCFAAVRRSVELYTLVWRVQILLLNLTVAAFAFGPCYDLSPKKLHLWIYVFGLSALMITVLSLVTLHQTHSYLTGFTFFAGICLSITAAVSVYLVKVQHRRAFRNLIVGLTLALAAGIFMMIGDNVDWNIPIDGNTPCHLLVALAAWAYYRTYMQSVRYL